MKSGIRLTVALLAVGVLTSGIAFGAKKGSSEQLFGPTGIIGDAGKTSITVQASQKGSPAEGKLKKGDVIIGLGKAKFSNVKRDMVKAIDEAETVKAGGKMTLMLKGNKTVEITLPVLGSYSATAPYQCAKTDKIITMTADSLLMNKKGLESRLHPELLGLMATGEKKYIAAVAEAIQNADWAKPDQTKVDAIMAGTEPGGYTTWSWGYHLITMCEYYLLTGDKSVLPGIKTYSVAMAKGQDAGGCYGHRFISPARFNRLPGYGQMNQPTLTCFMSMLLAHKCGVRDPALDKGIRTTFTYVDSHVGKGAFPYGVHGANSGVFNNNGTSGSAAICMALLKRTEATKFFSRLAAPSYDGLESGHASTFFNPFWTPLGAHLSGPEVTQQFFKKSLWFHNLRRGFDGSWSPDWKEGPHEGIALLTYCQSRNALLITGRKADESIWVKGQDATDVVMAHKIDYKSKSNEDLAALATDHFLPQVRRKASSIFGERREALTPTWIKYLKEGTDKQKLLAIGQYGWWHPIEARLPQLDDIGALLRDSNQSIEIRLAAAGSVAYMGEPAQKYYMDIVKFLAQDRPSDSLGLLDMGLGKSINVLCKTPFTSGLVTDKDLFYKAALKLVRHKRQNARTEGLKMLAEISLDDLGLIANDVMHVIKDQDPAYHSYHNPGGPVTAAITILANHNIKEGIDLAMAIEKSPSGKGSFKSKATWAVLGKYGANAKDALKEYNERHDNRTNWGRNTGGYKKMVTAIEEDKNPAKLISLKEALAAGKK